MKMVTRSACVVAVLVVTLTGCSTANFAEPEIPEKTNVKLSLGETCTELFGTTSQPGPFRRVIHTATAITSRYATQRDYRILEEGLGDLGLIAGYAHTQLEPLLEVVLMHIKNVLAALDGSGPSAVDTTDFQTAGLEVLDLCEGSVVGR